MSSYYVSFYFPTALFLDRICRTPCFSARYNSSIHASLHTPNSNGGLLTCRLRLLQQIVNVHVIKGHAAEVHLSAAPAINCCTAPPDHGASHLLKLVFESRLFLGCMSRPTIVCSSRSSPYLPVYTFLLGDLLGESDGSVHQFGHKFDRAAGFLDHSA